ncbi:Protein TIFY 6B like [Actinidia chinensis var. chinensis]|uniref:Protein TIFY n=1 Tax=Actinidia chinensis var. chinensis TaxID=1590841 RepID=A0A2R6PGS0_ACTCC|nr:Protein TIFY 6B like [Actinidia chinensis var. chinensis]
MERDFLGLNSKDSVVVVKEEAVEGCKDSEFVPFSNGSGVQWPLSNKVSALPHFMSFKAQEEKMAKSMSDIHTSFGYMGISADGFDTTHKRPLGEMQKVHHGQGGTHFSMTNYPVQPNALSMHLSHEMNVLPAANQPISVSMANPFFKPHFTGAGQDFSGATMKQQLLGGISATAPHSVLPSLGSAAATTEPWFCSKSSAAPAQLTIFYGRTVNVFDDISPEKAQAIMFLAGNGATTASNMAQPRPQVQVPASKQAGGDGVLVNYTSNTPPGSGFSSPMYVSSHPVGLSGNGCPTNDEVMAVKPIGVLSTPLSQADTKAVTSLGPLAATTMIPSAVPQARKASLARFLEKRKERAMSSAPYLSKKSPECFPPVSNGAFSP